jgi:hypothetical protein
VIAAVLLLAAAPRFIISPCSMANSLPARR